MAMAVPSLVLDWEGKLHQVSAAGTGSIPVQMVRNLERCTLEAHQFFGLPPGTYDLYDKFGKIEHPEDLQRALDTAGGGECTIEIREHSQFTQIRDLETENRGQNERMAAIEASIRAAEQRADEKLETSKDELTAYIGRVERKILDELVPTIGELCRDRDQLQKDVRKAQEKLRQINIRELQEMKQSFDALQEEVKVAVKRVDRIDTMWTMEKARLEEDISRTQSELKELARYVQGKIDICIQSDADLAHDHQLLEERVKLLADDLGLLTGDHKYLNEQCAGNREKEEELRGLLVDVRTSNERLETASGHSKTRLTSLELSAMEQWNGFFPGVLYFRSWHRLAKGADVQLSRDLMVVTGRNNLMATGVMPESDEGLAVADGPCRRFGEPGNWATYYELEMDEVCGAPRGSGGLYAGVAIQNGDEIAAHPHHEFDGWLIGGPVKALICRAGSAGTDEPDPDKLPATWAPGAEATETAAESVRDNVEMLRVALPRRMRGEIRSVDSCWESESLTLGDRVGLLFRCKPEGGARLRVAVNGIVVAQHDFVDAPPADAIGFLTPLVRLSGTGKSVKLLRGMHPPPEMLAR
mmetsp:Transcript_85578/g.242652  ORF Transcript_85578/g.242652 Transcript_85578/m.242652 type:complete len:585 (-) Transcript_85578:245-1999(-)